MDKIYETTELIWKSHENYLGKQTQELKNFIVTDYLANLFCPGEYYYYVLNSPTLTLDIVSPGVEKLLGVRPEDFSIRVLSQIIHPDDVEFFLKCEDVVAYFLKNCIPPEKMVHYKISYCLREKTKHRGYRLFLLQTITIQTTPEGALLKVFGSHTDISHITEVNNHKLSLIGLNGEPSFHSIDVFSDEVLDGYKPYSSEGRLSDCPFSKRELDIVRLLSSGLNTEEIATKLFVSRNTVESHRRNILRKCDAKNTVQLVADCIRLGYI